MWVYQTTNEMSPLILTLKEIVSLNEIKSKISNDKALSTAENQVLSNFFCALPKAKKILVNRPPDDRIAAVEVFDFEEIKPHLKRWIELFNNLPKNGGKQLPYAWITISDDYESLKDDVIISVAFVPSIKVSHKRGLKRLININLKINGTASFTLNCRDDHRTFEELSNFTGSWRDAYLLTVKTLQQGWPQTKFPKEFEMLLRK